MNTTDLEQLGFEHAADVFVRDGVPDALFTDFGKTVCTGVYCWVQQDADGKQQVIYVGKFGKALTKRFREHRQGFAGGSGSGVKKAAYIYESLDTGAIVQIYAKASARVPVTYTNILGKELDSTVTTEGTDETDMIEYVTQLQGKPVLNGTKGG